MSTESDSLADFILTVADFYGVSANVRQDAKPEQIWQLRKSLCGLPARSIVTRAQLAQAHAASLTATIPAQTDPKYENL